MFIVTVGVEIGEFEVYIFEKQKNYILIFYPSTVYMGSF